MKLNMRQLVCFSIKCFKDFCNFYFLARKYYTSKIDSYDDLESLHTFGFRGEALNSLCSLSNLTIITRTKETLNATKLEYDPTGNIKTKKPCARSNGTSVILENLFYSLPVRHKEFLKNIKKEYSKLLYLIQSYCLISDGVKFTCFNTISSKCTKLISTNSKNTLKDNIIEIFGIQSMNNSVKFEQACELNEEIKVEFKIDCLAECDLFQIEGYISNCKNNHGRSAQDRQYLYINKRPCESQRVIKLINEVYRNYNQNQYPMFILNISLNSKDVDVNVTPDKLKIFIKNENILLGILKGSLKNMFSPPSDTQQQEDLSFIVNETLNESETSFKKTYNFQYYKQQQQPTNDEPEITKEPLIRIEPVASKKRIICASDEDNDVNEEPNTLNAKKNKVNNTEEFDLCPKYKQTTINNIVVKQDELVCIKSVKSDNKASKIPNMLFQNNIGSNIQLSKSQNPVNESNKKLFELNDSLSTRLDLHFNKDFNDDSMHKNEENNMFDNLKKLGYKYNSPSDHDLTVYESDAEVLSHKNTKEFASDSEEDEGKAHVDTDSDYEQPKKAAALKLDFASTRKVIEINFSLEKLLQKNKVTGTQKSTLDANKYLNIKFKPKSFDSKEAESELDRYIEKNDFKEMYVCGQFNKGFIVTKLQEDLFIVDQHAADEIYNFEQLQITNKIDKQRLLQPHYLELSPTAETLLIENEQLLEKAGYVMQVVKNRKVGNRIMLTSVPTSKKQKSFFDSSDIDELLFILNENNISCCDDSVENVDNLQKLHQIKPSSLRAMYASKACRKSVMIGDSLNKFEMKRIVTHLSEIVKPWNCPHGRPTLRHLINLDLFKNISQ
jgi:DNA mismatch repair protein PMS2